nr:uncharacterized protein LOC109430201 [Aedes albopictus]
MTKTATTTTARHRVVHHWGGNGSLTRLEIHRIWRKLMLTVRNFWERRSKRKLRIVLALSATTVKPKKFTLPLQNTVWFGAWLSISSSTIRITYGLSLPETIFLQRNHGNQLEVSRHVVRLVKVIANKHF